MLVSYSNLTRQMLRHWRHNGIRCTNYIDDFIFFARTLEEVLAVRARVLAFNG